MEANGCHTIEIHQESPHDRRANGTSSFKVCGEALCGFSNPESTSKDAKERSASMRKLFIVVALCVVFMGVEVAGGIKANSLAILTDAAHLLSDVAAFAISLFALWASGWEATPRQTYGFFRVEILGALVSIQLIWLLAGILVYEAVLRLVYNTGQVDGFLMFLVAAFGFVVNVAMAVLLGHDHGHGHGQSHGHDHTVTISNHDHAHDHGHRRNHSHDHDHVHDHGRSHDHGHVHDNGRVHGHKDALVSIDDTRKNKQQQQQPSSEIVPAQGMGNSRSSALSSGQSPRRGFRYDEDMHDHKEALLSSSDTGRDKKRNINVQGAYLHVLGDSIQSVGVMIGGAVIWWRPEWKIIDVICTLVFSVVVLATTIKMLRDILEVLMESTPREIDATKLQTGLVEMEEVVAVHELHIWAITVGKILLACHIKIRQDANADVVLDKVVGYIRKEYNISHVTIQIERDD